MGFYTHIVGMHGLIEVNSQNRCIRTTGPFVNSALAETVE